MTRPRLARPLVRVLAAATPGSSVPCDDLRTPAERARSRAAEFLAERRRQLADRLERVDAD